MDNENEKARKPEPEIDLDEELVGEAFELKAGDRLQLEKKILSVAFLSKPVAVGATSQSTAL